MKTLEAAKHLRDWIEYATNPAADVPLDQPCTDDEILEAMKKGADALESLYSSGLPKNDPL